MILELRKKKDDDLEIEGRGRTDGRNRNEEWRGHDGVSICIYGGTGKLFRCQMGRECYASVEKDCATALLLRAFVHCAVFICSTC